jgi:K+-sensing histidine kinase KdpD
MSSNGLAGPAIRPGSAASGSFRRCPPGFGLAMSFAVLFTVTALMTPLRHALHGAPDLGILAATVFVLGLVITTGTSLAAAGLSALLLNGFLVDHDGTLHWHGSVELLRLAILLGAAMVGSTIGAIHLRRARRAAAAPLASPDSIVMFPASSSWVGPVPPGVVIPRDSRFDA